MKNFKWIIVWGVLLLWSCEASQADLGNFETVEIDSCLLDSLTKNRLSNFKEISEASFLFGGIRMRNGGSTANSSPVTLEKLNNLLEVKDTMKTIYDPNLQRLILKPEISYEEESKYWGIYKRKKTTIRGIQLDMLSKDEIAAIKLKPKK